MGSGARARPPRRGRRSRPNVTPGWKDGSLHLDHDHSHNHLRDEPPRPHAQTLRVGIGGPVGSGKTALVAALCRALSGDLHIGVVTNDIYTTEDADFLRREAVLPDRLIRAVETGCCPHTAIRDDIAANDDAIEHLEQQQGPLDLVLLES